VDGKLSVTALKSAGDQWRIAQVGYIDDFYLEAEFISGDVCNGKDSYGVLVRAPDQEDNILDSGYVFVISCDGYFRAYLLVNGTFVNLINWSRSPEINLGPNQRNILGIRAIENDYQLYVNNAQLYEFEDTTFATGNFGISIRSDTTQNFQAFVEQISLWTEFD